MISREELERLYDEHADAAFGLFLKFARNEEDARDLLQDWLMKISKQAIPDGIKNEKSWLLKIAYRLAVDWSRKNKSRNRTVDQAADHWLTSFSGFCPENDPDREKIRIELERALAILPVDQRTVVELKLWEDLKFHEIADTLELSPNTVASRYRYGIDKLRDLLQTFYTDLCQS